MRTLLLTALCAAVAVDAAAQIQTTPRAFEPSISPWIGIASFGTRQTANDFEASYRGSVTIGVRGELPLTRRVGLLGNVSLSPVAKQRYEGPVTTELRDNVVIMRGDLALGWRFIPRAPVFFFAGGGIIRATRPAFPDFDQAVTEPRGLFGFGYDRPAQGRWNFRLTATGFVSKPAEPDPLAWDAPGTPPNVATKSTVFDWSVEIGARYRFNRGS